jgi:thiosulfate/3-mercaptopyruvate sulfurtransferase
MAGQLTRRRYLVLTGSVGIAAVSGCQGDGDGTSTSTRTDTPTSNTSPTPSSTPASTVSPSSPDTVLVGPEQVQAWNDAGLVNGERSAGERVVVLRVGNVDSYEDGHLPGAVPWEPLHQTRLEALAPTSPLVPTGDVVDEVIQMAGVDEETTILISPSNPLFGARAYWTLRYWGFPRRRVKLLDAGYSQTGLVEDLVEGGPPDLEPSEYSVRDLGGPNADLRLSLGEMIQLVDGVNAGDRPDQIVDLRSGPDATIATATIVPSPSLHGGDAFDSVAAWHEPADLETTFFEEAGIDPDGPIVTYCNTGYQGAMGFFALDGLLNVDDVAVYDGSFDSQWRHYDENAEPTPNDAWRVDRLDRTDGDTGDSSLSIDPALNNSLTSVTSPDANQIERADAAYVRGETPDGETESSPTPAGGETTTMPMGPMG